MRYITPILKENKKTPGQFINFVCDDRRNHDLWKYEGESLIRVDANNGSAKEIYIDERLNSTLDKFLNDETLQQKK